MKLIADNRTQSGSKVDVVIIGAGHAGLSASYLLSQQGIGHVVLERGDVANSWRQERWDSLRLLTPNWQTRLPGHYYNGNDPDGYMDKAELIRFIEQYADLNNAPVSTGTNVQNVSRTECGYLIQTNQGDWYANAVIIATGACSIPNIPSVARDLPSDVKQLTPFQYHGPQDVDDGAVLVVGASASGMQLADELLQAGRHVTVATGEHVRLPRRYRGRDILYWMDRSGVLGESYDEVDDIIRARSLPSAQLVGSNSKPLLDLNSLTDQGARVFGRLMGLREGVAQFSGSLANVCALADLKMNRLLRTIDDAIGSDTTVSPAENFAPTRVPENTSLTLSLEKENIKTVIWATGFRPDYSWLDIEVFDRKGRLNHDGGVVDSPGLYVLGLPMMRRRKSSFIYGIEQDAGDITGHLVSYLKTRTNSLFNRDSESKDNGLYPDHTDCAGERRCAGNVPTPATTLGLFTQLRKGIQPPA